MSAIAQYQPFFWRPAASFTFISDTQFTTVSPPGNGMVKHPGDNALGHFRFSNSAMKIISWLRRALCRLLPTR